MRFEILGPLRVSGDDGRELSVTRPRVRALLTVLLLLANRPVRSARLSEALYDDFETGHGSSLRTHIWWLRQDLAPERRVHTVNGGYLLEVKPGETDLERFRDLAERGRKQLRNGEHEDAARLLEQACGLWRDSPLADVPRTADLVPMVERLLDERRYADEQLAEARLALGEHREILSDLRARVEIDPLDELACEQLLTALYRSGRKHEAFEVYSQLRRTLADLYGALPGAAVQELYQRILQEDPTLHAPAAARQPTGAGVLPPALRPVVT